MREARRRDHAGRGAEARHGRRDGSFTPGDRTKISFIFRCRFANSALRDPLGGRSRRALHLKVCIIALTL